jgi:hypothetical protein
VAIGHLYLFVIDPRNAKSAVGSPLRRIAELTLLVFDEAITFADEDEVAGRVPSLLTQVVLLY